MPKYKVQAPNFRKGGGAKEFIHKDGRTYLILKFPDPSGLILRRVKGTREASADYKPVKNQKEILRKLGCKEAPTYRMIASLFKR